MNVLSLFDGMATGLVALKRANINIDTYFASEIDKYAIQIAKKNHPEIIELGDVEKWKEWKLPHIDIIIAGSPCQGFSKAGKGLNFDDPRSKLFFEFVDILNFYKPKYFLLENVKMKNEWRNIITEYLDVEPVLINSALVSAQNRERYYWTNIGEIEQPKNKNILLKDIIESGTVERKKSLVIDSNYFKGGSRLNLENKLKNNNNKIRQSEKRLMVKDANYILSEREKKYMDRATKDGRDHWAYKHHSDTKEDKSHAVVANFWKGVPYSVLIDSTKEELIYRKLTPTECEVLQTLDKGYTDGVSNTQRYKMIGNGWTADVIAHIFSYLPNEYKSG